MVTRLILVRHCETQANGAVAFQGEVGVPLIHLPRGDYNLSRRFKLCGSAQMEAL